ncbi:MAG TPA: hypothetical protein VI230_04375, partial [Ignavibacteriaceae bacterium]
MKRSLLAAFLLLTYSAYAQFYPPRAGEVSSVKVNKAEFINSMRSGNTIPDALEALNFDSSNVSFKGNYPFSVSYSLAMSPTDDLVFVGSGGGIYVTDVTDPQNPVILSEIRTRSLVDDCSYDPVSKRLYVCAYFSGIEIWDLSDIYNPVRMCRIPTEPYPRSGVAYNGNYLFFTTNNSLWSYDITDPYNPVSLDDLYIGSTLIVQLYLRGNIIYVTDGQGLKLINVSDPLNLQLIHSYSFIAYSKFDISGDYLYAINNSALLKILNISDSLNVTSAGSLTLTGYTQDITVNNDKAYVSSTGGGMSIVDVHDPSAPSLISLYPGNYQFIQGRGNYVYLSLNSDFSILDVTDPNSVQYVSGYEVPGFVEDVAVSGNYLYTGSNGFRVYDISDSTHPVQTGYADISGDLVEPAGEGLVFYTPYSMTANNTIHTMDVTDPHNPVSLDSYTCPNMTWDFVVRDTLAYVACWWDGIRIFNIADPSNIVQIAHTMGWQQGGVPGVDYCYSQTVAVYNDYLYIADYGPFSEEDTYGLYILDITDPSHPVLLNRFQGITSHASDIAAGDGLVYIADGFGGVEIVDVSDPLNPSVISYTGLPDGATGIKINDNYAYVSDYILGGTQMIDITDPSAPFVAGWYKPSGCFAVGVDYSNGYLYTADGIA